MSNRQINMLPRRAETIEVRQTRPKLRLALVLALLVFGIGAILLGLRNNIAARPGWIEIMANSAQNENCSAEFSFRYRLGKNSTAEYRAAVEVYTEASERAFQVFHPTRGFEGVGNLYSVNASPNEPVRVERELYEALELLDRRGERSMFLAPVYTQLDAVFRSVSDDEAASYDPALDGDAKEYAERFLVFATDPESVRLELLGNGMVCLHVSEDYLALAAEYGADCFVDLYWMRNAFAADLIAGRLREAGLERGFLVSTDGFGVCLEQGSENYALRVTEHRGGVQTAVEELYYTGPLALVDLRGFPQSEGTEDYFFLYGDGTLRTPYLSAADGAERLSLSELYLCSRQSGCAELLLSGVPLFVADGFDRAAADALAEQGTAVLCFTDGELYENAAAQELLTAQEPGK